MRGRVLRVSGLQSLVEADASQWLCEVRSRLKSSQRVSTSTVVAGDWVEFTPTAETSGIIDDVYPRVSKISRVASGSRPYEQLLAANVDLLIIVLAARNPSPRPGFVDRALVAAQIGELEPVICINKVDLDPEHGFRELADTYRRLDYRIALSSAVTGEGMDDLRTILCDRVSVLVGQSGVGKSSILNHLDPALGITTGKLMRRHDRGRHTTSATQLHPLAFGGYVADTPGIKQLRPWGLDRASLVRYFVEMAPLADQCRFRDCLHRDEPGCAIVEAVDRGEIAPARYDGFRRMEASLGDRH